MNLLPYLYGYAAFLGGFALYFLQKIYDYNKQAKLNPNPALKFSFAAFWSDEWINVVRILIAGIAVVIFLPMLIGGTTVELTNSKGAVMTSFEMKTALLPMYFFLAYSGGSGVFALLGKYKTTFLNQLGVDENKKD